MMRLILLCSLALFSLSLSLVSANILHRHASSHQEVSAVTQHPNSHIITSPAAATNTWSIDYSKSLINVSQDLFGIFFEEINHAGHGGLYAQMIQNTNFEDTRGIVDPWYTTDPNTVLVLDQSMPLNGHQPTSLQAVTKAGSSAANVVIINPGFWGINLAAHTQLDVSFYAYSSQVTSVTVSFWATVKDASPIVQQTQGITKSWTQNSFTLTVPANNATMAAFSFSYTVAAGSTARVNFDVVSVLPTQGWNGIPYLRADLAQYVADLHPAFMRFPGGCYVEGQIIANRFNWKHALGRPEDRTGHWNLWGYWSEDVLGLLEYLTFIEQLKDPFGNPTRAIWVVNNGISHEESIAPADIEPYVQDALDSIEFAQGSTDTYWGALRASMGHAAPFTISYIAIGNEDCGKPSYLENYALFYKALNTAYPSIQLISNCAPQDMKGNPIQVWDYHIYTSADNLIKGSTTFDAPSYHAAGAPKVFNSEYAVTDGAGRGNLMAAIGEAAWMTGLERNGDAVSTASYAPLFVNDNDRHWSPDAIVFNSFQRYGTPSYWNQLIFSNSFNDIQAGTVSTLAYVLSSNNTFVSVTKGMSRSRANTVVLVHKLVNTVGTATSLDVTLNNLPGKLAATADVVVLSGTDPNAENSFAAPEAIVPVNSQVSLTSTVFTVKLPPYSVTILRAYVSL